MLPIVAIVGRPNVGKSTLFNCLTKTRDAIVANYPGLTRDRQYGIVKCDQHSFIVIDTGGITQQKDSITSIIEKQVQQAIEEAHVILWLVDGKAGLTDEDEEIAQQLRRIAKPVKLILNKTEGLDPSIVTAEFYRLGFKQMYSIAAAHRLGIDLLIAGLSAILPKAEQEIIDVLSAGIKVAIVGKPNVGKSTLVNRLLGEERVIVFDQPGTTRDSISISIQHDDKPYTLIDTAGVRRKAKILDTVEKFSVIKTLQAIEESNVVLLIIDAQVGVTEQDLHLLSFILASGRSLIIAVNKWDGLELSQRRVVKGELERRLAFVDFADLHFISALHGSGVGKLWQAIDLAYAAANKKMATPQLTRILEKAILRHQPPLVQGRRIKLRYAHPGGNNPPLVVIHGNQTQHLPDAYRRYLAGVYRKALRLTGTPVRFEFKNSENPYHGKKNILTRKQYRKRQRIRQKK